jgi:hypothetical protein
MNVYITSTHTLLDYCFAVLVFPSPILLSIFSLPDPSQNFLKKGALELKMDPEPTDSLFQKQSQSNGQVRN